MNFPFYIARRYTVSFSKSSAINIITGIASLGIIVGAGALFVVLSVFSGLKDFSLSFSNDFDPDLKITSTLGKSFFISPEQEKKIEKINGIATKSHIIEERVLFLYEGKEVVTYLKGVDSIYSKVNNVEKSLNIGEWLEPKTPQVVVGYGIYQKLSLGLLSYSNPLEVYVPKPGKGTINNAEQAFNKSAILPVGVYAVSEELDEKYVFADLNLAQELLEFKPNQVTGIEFKLKPGADEAVISEQLQTIFNNKLTVKNRAQLNDSLYKMLNTEQTALYLIFTLVIILTLFTLAGAIIMLIIDKKSNLTTLYNLGVEVKNLRKIFLFQGSILTLTGGSIGLILGIIIVLLQQKYNLVMVTPSMPYPVIFNIENLVIVLATIFSLGFISSLIASSRVTKKLLD
ncbi:lipoprotein-releasing system permease protein [Flavobacterium endophyticum]|uniref:Lipoprotein-releasing system permease protein n=1 Tax=Flavobacterium endophyticum TaxID=1540163 RepID=A0A495MJH9_9FLAO|nr:FtsX-like permease family protein [Flavobacterium endophyticum]RKS26141.1 lipoprotein-releasing system permease protein [Flavobacterium endophyticum]